MHGDIPPAVVAIEADLLRGARTADVAWALEAQIMRRPTWVVAREVEPLRRALAARGLHLPVIAFRQGIEPQRLAGALVAGDVMVAFHVAAALGGREVRVWAGEATAAEQAPMAVLIRAHDDGIRLVVEAPVARRGAAA